jgi:adenosylmethionine-8-amino-7-oxononanoate aminotransferase
MVRANASSLAAVILEPLVQGAEGMRLSPPGGVRALWEACRETGVLFIADEVATGFGRTGTLFASEQCGITPDLMCIGKGLTGGYLPMAATVASGAVFDAFLGPDLSEFTLYHGHSFSGNALCAAVARRHLQLFDELDVLANVRARAAQLAARLKAVSELARVREVRQQGLMVGVELAPPRDGLRWGRRVCAEAVRRGVLLRPLGDVVVLMPVLTSTAEEIDRIVDTLVASINALD